MGRSDACGSLLGTTFPSRRWLSLDPCGLCCVALSFSIHAFALYVIPTHLISHSSAAMTLFLAAYCPAAALALTSLFTAWTTDPGAVPMGARPLPVPTTTKGEGGGDEEAPAVVPANRRRGIRRCRKCNDNYKPPRAHHDSVTGRCIVKMDHFCPWVGNAVGALNHKFFFLFILYTMITSILSLILLLMRFVRCGYVTEVHHDEGAAEPSGGAGEGNSTTAPGVGEEAETAATEGGELDPTLRHLDDSSDESDLQFKYPGCEQLFTHPILVLFVVTVAFLFFTCCMLTEQVDAIQSNTSKIARMKMRAGSADAAELGRVAMDFNEMFGGGPGWFGGGDGGGNGRGGSGAGPAWHWFLPLRVRFPDGTHDGVMGYEYDPSWGQLPYRESEDDGPSGTSTADGGKGKIVAGGAAAPSSSSSSGSLTAVAEHPLAQPKENGTLEGDFVEEDTAGSVSETNVPATKAMTATQARKRNKAESGDNERTVPTIV